MEQSPDLPGPGWGFGVLQEYADSDSDMQANPASDDDSYGDSDHPDGGGDDYGQMDEESDHSDYQPESGSEHPAPEDGADNPIALSDEDTRILLVVQYIKKQGFSSLSAFLQAFLNSEAEPVRRRVRGFVRRLDGVLVKLISLSPYFSSKRKQLKAIRQPVLHAEILQALLPWLRSVFRRDIRAIVEAPASRMSPKDLSPEYIRSFSFQDLDAHYATQAPTLYAVIRSICDADNPGSQGRGGERMEDQPRRRRRGRDKGVICTTAIALCAFAHSNHTNAFQTMMGYYLFASHTSKRTIAVLNQLGVSVAYNTVCSALNSAAEAERDLIRERVKKEPIVITYDNLTNYSRVGTETLFNKNVMYCFTAAAIFFLTMTQSLALRLGKSATTGVIVDDIPLPDNLPDQPPDDIAGDAESLGADATPDAPGLPHSKLFREPYWESLDVQDIINSQSIESYWPLAAKGMVCDIIWEFCGVEMEANPMKLERFKVPVLYQVPIKRSDLHTLATMQIDEATVEGNLEVLKEISSGQLELPLGDLVDKAILVSGDQLTVIRINSGQGLRQRDLAENRFLWAKTMPGLFHLRMSVIHMIYMSHIGRKDGRDPASLTKFIKKLGRTRVAESVPDLNAAHDLLMQVLKGHILAAIIARVGAQDLEELKVKLKTLNWRAVIEDFVDHYLPLRKVDQLRDLAKSNGKKRYEQQVQRERQAEVAGVGLARRAARERRQRGESELRTEDVPNTSQPFGGNGRLDKERLKAEQDVERDYVYENACLLLQHALIYWDFHTAIRSGDTGRVEKCLDMFAVMFQATSLSNYANLTLDMRAQRVRAWTPEMRELWLLNSVVNLSGKLGKFLAVDEFNEYVVREVKDAYNPRGSFESTQFTCNTVSRNVMSFRDAIRSVTKSSGAPTYGSRHSAPNARRDIMEILGNLLSEKVFQHQAGRVGGGTPGDPARVQESKDLFAIGITKLIATPRLADYRAKKLARQQGDTGVEMMTDEEELVVDQDMEAFGFGNSNMSFMLERDGSMGDHGSSGF